VEQFFDFAVELAGRIAVMDRGRIVLSGTPDALDEAEVRRWMTV
jgi:urea transport system ATP-binding protein